MTDDRDPLAWMRGHPRGWGFRGQSVPDGPLADIDEGARKMAVYWPMTLEDMADAGMTLLPDEIAELERRQRELDAWSRSWRGRWSWVRSVVGGVVVVIRHRVGDLLCHHDHHDRL